MTQTLRRPWLRHDVFDPRSALERGPLNGGDPVPCAGQLELVGGDGDVALLAVCATCGFEIGVRRSAVESFEEPTNEEEREPWWNR